MKFLVAGEALIDLIKQPDGSWIAHNGGGPLNTAKALAKLGEGVEFLARIAEDPFGLQLRQDISSSSVGTEFLVTATEPTSLAIVELSETGSAKYSFYLSNTSNFCWQPNELPEELNEFDVLHIGTLALVVEPGKSVLLEWVKQHKGECLIMMDLNVRPSVIEDANQYRYLLNPWMQYADILKVSDEDLQFLYPDKTWREAADDLFHQTEINLISVTMGSDGASLLTRTNEVTLPAPVIEVVDTVGAGDTFSAGLLAELKTLGLLAKESLDDLSSEALTRCLKFAITAAALNCKMPGAVAPSRRQVLDVLNAS